MSLISHISCVALNKAKSLDLHVKKLSSEQGMCLFLEIVCQGSTDF